MRKMFNIVGACIREKHYMVNIEKRLQKIKTLIDQGAYFTINRARQYGKTTTFREFLIRYLKCIFMSILFLFIF